MSANAKVEVHGLVDKALRHYLVVVDFSCNSSFHIVLLLIVALYRYWLCRYRCIPFLIFVCDIKSMLQAWVLASKERTKSKIFAIIPIVRLE